MIQGLNSSDARFLSALEKINARMETAQSQLSSGLKLQKASDAPDSVSAVLSARASLAQTTQIALNLASAQSEADTSEKTIQTVETLLERLRSIGSQGASETLAPDSRKTIAVEVSSILEQLINASATSVGGRYVFGGDTDTTAPYTLIPATDITEAAVSDFNGSESTRQIMHPNGTTFPVSHSAKDIFDADDGSVFQAVTALRDALLAVPTSAEGTTAYQTEYDAQTTQITTALDSIKAASTHISGQLAFYGVVQNRITEATNYASKLKLQQQQQLSTAQDADITAAALELVQAQTQQSTAMSARAKLRSTSLFDYLS
jgi:flagellar hook-associated protein 3 FlgL